MILKIRMKKQPKSIMTSELGFMGKQAGEFIIRDQENRILIEMIPSDDRTPVDEIIIPWRFGDEIDKFFGACGEIAPENVDEYIDHELNSEDLGPRNGGMNLNANA